MRIDRNPPDVTGDAENDLRAMQDYLYYLKDRLNYILSITEDKTR